MTVNTLNSHRIGVIAGGPSPERDGSYLSATDAHAALVRLGYTADVIDISDPKFQDAVRDIDVAFIAGHGWYAEDGKLQGMLEMLHIPYTGPGVLGSALGMHKPTFKTLLSAHELPTLPWCTIQQGSQNTDIERAVAELGLPMFIKPASSGESLHAGIARTETDAADIVSGTGPYAPKEYLAEPYLPGSSYTVGILSGPDGPQVFPVLEAIPLKEFYDAQAKSDEKYRVYKCPAPLAPHVTEDMQETALRVARLCRCEHLARVDFMITDSGPTVLEINTVPGLTHQGNLAATAQAAGIGYDEMIERILRTAYAEPTYIP